MEIRVAAVIAGVLLSGACSGAPRQDERAQTPESAATPASRAAGEWFTERAHETGLDFVHVNGQSGHFFYPEILPPGVALFDDDNDGDLDVFVVQGFALGPEVQLERVSGGRLFRNDLIVAADGARTLHFTDVTAESGLVTRGFGMGVATGDIDNDGWVDLYVTHFGGSQMFHNNGNGTFTDVTKQSGTANSSGFAVSTAFVDIDRDGWLDLYVGNNVNYRLDNKIRCPNQAGAPDYCPPQMYGALPDRLYRNQGHGVFVDITAKALIGGRFGPALGVATADFNGDGWMDIYVANDGQDNLLWINQKNGTFVESALAAGAAVTAEGKAEASMGLDAGDFDNDGDEDLVVAELTGQGTNLFVNDGHGRFRDVSASSGIGPQSLPYTGWGTAWFDYDNDGWLDFLSVNGTIIQQEGRPGQPFPYDQKKILFHNLGTGRFEHVSERAGRAFELSESGRGAAFGDIDNDGDIDVVVANDNGPLRLLINNVGNRQRWLGLRLVAPTGRDLLGAVVTVVRADGSTLTRRARSDGSYGSANDSRVLIGLGTVSDPPSVRVQWPDGRSESWDGVAIDRWMTLTEGSGR
jgi:enediyne biosynthesis protein E4